MINLLPPKEKIELLSEQTRRIVVIIGSVVLLSLFCLILILFSVKTYLGGQVESQRIIFRQAEREFKVSEIQDFQEKIETINLTFSELNSFYQKKLHFVEILKRISETLLPGTYLTNISVSPLTEEEFRTKISLSGFAKTREILFEFKKNLEGQTLFKEIYFPPINWMKPTDIDFNVTFKVDIR